MGLLERHGEVRTMVVNNVRRKSLRSERRLERKPAGVHAEALGEYFSMWANTPPEGGLIAVGVENNGRISGCLNTGIDHINSLESSGKHFCPQAHYEVKRVNVRRDDGQRDYVLLFRVYFRSGKKVVRTVKNKAYIRLGGSKHTLNEYEIREIEIDTGEVAFEQELADYVYPHDFGWI